MKKLELTESQRANLAARLTLKPNRTDLGELLPLTAAALTMPTRTVQEAADRTAALARAITTERLVVPIPVESHPDSADHKHQPLGEDDHVPLATTSQGGEQVVVGFTSAKDLSDWDRTARPMVMETARVALTAGLTTKVGSILINPASADPVHLAPPIVHALAGGDEWLPPWEDKALIEELVERAQLACPAVVSVGIEPSGDDQEMWLGEVNVIVYVDAARGTATEEFRICITRALQSVADEPRLAAIAPKVNLVPKPVQTA